MVAASVPFLERTQTDSCLLADASSLTQVNSFTYGPGDPQTVAFCAASWGKQVCARAI